MNEAKKDLKFTRNIPSFPAPLQISDRPGCEWCVWVVAKDISPDPDRIWVLKTRSGNCYRHRNSDLPPNPDLLSILGRESLMRSRPRLLDGCCCAGGGAWGYHLAGFDVTGVDIEPQPHYPFEFIQADIRDVLADGGFLSRFDAIHLSPPCQKYSPLNAYNHVGYPDIVGTVRELAAASGLPFVMENVVQAPLRDPVILCGKPLGLLMYRHRGFEAGNGVELEQPEHKPHTELCTRNGYLPTAERPFMSIHGGKHSRAWQRKAAEVMGTPWMETIREVCEAIPPAYTEFTGQFLIRAVRPQLAVA